jgi:hypothetical protein
LSWLVPLQGTRPRTWRVCWGVDIWRVYATRGQQYTPSKYRAGPFDFVGIWSFDFEKKNTSERSKWNISHIFLAESLDTTSKLLTNPTIRRRISSSLQLLKSKTPLSLSLSLSLYFNQEFKKWKKNIWLKRWKGGRPI